SGTTVQDVNRLLKQLQQMQTVMKRTKKMGMGGMMGMMKNMMGSDDAEALMKSVDPNALADDMAGLPDEGPLGANPFAPGGPLARGGFGGMGGMPPGMGLPMHGGKKKDRKKNKRK